VRANRNQNEMLRMFPDADGIMYVFLHYSFIKKDLCQNTFLKAISFHSSRMRFW